MAELDIDVVGTEEVIDLLNELPEHLFDVAKIQISKSVFEVQSNITTPMRVGARGLQSRTGNLARSIQAEVTGETLDSISGTVSTRSTYAPSHELGYKISAKRAYTGVPGGPYLNIPLSANKTPAGVMRKTAGVVFASGGYIIKSKRGNWIVMLAGTPMFVLKKSVQLKKTLFMIKSAEDEVPTLLSNLDRQLLEGL